MTQLSVTFLGTSASVPTVRRSTSAISVVRGGDLFLFDCGEGTLRQMMRFGGAKAPRAIFITHGHGDHWLGLSGVLATLELQEHNKPLDLFLPAHSGGKIQQALQAGGLPAFVEVHRGEEAYEDYGDFAISSFPTNHTPESRGFVLAESARPGKFDPRLATLSGIEPGPDFKRLQDGETVKGLRPEDVIGPPRPGRKIVYTGDTASECGVSAVADNADLLIHEATFEDERHERARKTRHTTGRQAGRVAQDARKLDRLVLTHFSPRSNPSVIVKEASQHFSPIQAAHDGMTIDLPMQG